MLKNKKWIVVLTLLMIMTTILSSASAAPDAVPSIGEIAKYLVIGMGDNSDVGDAFLMSNTEIGADRTVLSTAADLGCVTNGSFPNLVSIFGSGRWNTGATPDSMNGALSLFEGVDWSGEVALTSSGGKANPSNSLVFAGTGIQVAGSSGLASGAGNSDYFANGVNPPCSNAATLGTGNGVSLNNNFTTLLSDLTSWKTFIEGLTAEETITSLSNFQNNVGNNGNDGLRTNYDSNDTNSDNIVVIDINPQDEFGDFNLTNLDWVLEGNGSQLLIFRLRNGSNMIMNNVSILCGENYGAQELCAIFYSGYDGDSGDTVFNGGSNVVLNGIGLWDLNAVGEGGGDVKTNININNAQGCAQFISQQINFQNNRWVKCQLFDPTAIDLYGVSSSGPTVDVAWIASAAILLLVSAAFLIRRRQRNLF